VAGPGAGLNASSAQLPFALCSFGRFFQPNFPTVRMPARMFCTSATRPAVPSLRAA
jgi:hypothetical protein